MVVLWHACVYVCVCVKFRNIDMYPYIFRARPPNVCHYVHMYVGTSTCERMYRYMCVREDLMQACACARVFARAAGAATQPEVATSSCESLCTFICGYV